MRPYMKALGKGHSQHDVDYMEGRKVQDVELRQPYSGTPKPRNLPNRR